MSVLLFFIDGLGIGKRIAQNPLHGLDEAQPLAVFDDEEPALLYDGVLVRTDATLGVEGRPQSASGQTTILTGINAPKLLGYHKQGFPNKALLEVIEAHSIFLQLKSSRLEPNTFANAYTRRFFDEKPRWVSATTAAMQAANMRFRDLEDLRAGRAVFQDFTNRMLVERGEDVQERTAEEAGRILATLASEHEFTLYEYFITDKVGHLQDMERARTILTELAKFLRTLIDNLDLRRTTLIVTSDHGNIEDLSFRNHTLNPVPTLLWGARAREMAGRIKSLADITPAILHALTSRVN